MTTLRRGDLVQFETGYPGNSWQGTVRFLRAYGDDSYCQIRLTTAEQRRYYIENGRWTSRELPCFAVRKALVTLIRPLIPRGIYDPPPRYGPYRPIPKRLP